MLQLIKLGTYSGISENWPTCVKNMLYCEKRRVNLRAFVWSPLFAGRAGMRPLASRGKSAYIFSKVFCV